MDKVIEWTIEKIEEEQKTKNTKQRTKK